jgi:hypothetical protein
MHRVDCPRCYERREKDAIIECQNQDCKTTYCIECAAAGCQSIQVCEGYLLSRCPLSDTHTEHVPERVYICEECVKGGVIRDAGLEGVSDEFGEWISAKVGVSEFKDVTRMFAIERPAFAIKPFIFRMDEEGRWEVNQDELKQYKIDSVTQ